MRQRLRWFHLEAVSPPFSMWWCVFQPGVTGQFRRLVFKGQLLAAKSKRSWLMIFIRRLCLWPFKVVRETRRCRQALLHRGIELEISWLSVVLLGVFAGIPPAAYFHLELYRRPKASSLTDFVFPNELLALSISTRSRSESMLLADKRLFFDRLIEAGIPTPPIVATRHREGFRVSPSFHDYQSWFAKPARGHGGRGCAQIDRTESGGYVLRGSTPLGGSAGGYAVQHRELSLEGLLQLLASDTFAADLILQPRIENASHLAAIAPSGLGVVRLVTGRSRNGISPIAACYCMPAGKRIASQYGVFSQIALETGVLSEAADFSISGARRARHPDTFLLVKGLTIPDWRQCVELAIDAHQLFRKTSFIGWDIAPTPDSHLLLEGNLNFDVQMLQKWPAGPLLKTPMRKVLSELSAVSR